MFNSTVEFKNFGEVMPDSTQTAQHAVVDLSEPQPNQHTRRMIFYCENLVAIAANVLPINATPDTCGSRIGSS